MRHGADSVDEPMTTAAKWTVTRRPTQDTGGETVTAEYRWTVTTHWFPTDVVWAVGLSFIGLTVLYLVVR